jgi:small subunit ribosomal protein S4
MTKRESSKYKIDRRMGENIWGRNKSPIGKRAYGPGQHGQRKSRKLSDYGTQLRAKQKLKGYYGNINERQFRRLDAVIFRAKFAPTPFSSRQLVSHGHVQVNGKRVTIPSYLVKEGDTISLGAKAKDMGLVLETVKLPEREVPDYIEADHTKMTAKFLRTPKLSDVPYAVQMQPSLVVEFYSR